MAHFIGTLQGSRGERREFNRITKSLPYAGCTSKEINAFIDREAKP